MNTMTLNIEIPQGVVVDAKRLSVLATDYVQHYVYMLHQSNSSSDIRKRARAAVKNLRGVMSSNKSYKEMVEEVMIDKYENLL